MTPFLILVLDPSPVLPTNCLEMSGVASIKNDLYLKRGRKKVPAAGEDRAEPKS
jgi:hypothetical protein